MIWRVVTQSQKWEKSWTNKPPDTQYGYFTFTPLATYGLFNFDKCIDLSVRPEFFRMKWGHGNFKSPVAPQYLIIPIFLRNVSRGLFVTLRSTVCTRNTLIWQVFYNTASNFNFPELCIFSFDIGTLKMYLYYISHLLTFSINKHSIHDTLLISTHIVWTIWRIVSRYLVYLNIIYRVKTDAFPAV